MILIAQEYAGCFYIDQAGQLIDLNNWCVPAEIRHGTSQNEFMPTMTQEQVYLTRYRELYCENIDKGHGEASRIASDGAMDEIIKLFGSLEVLSIESFELNPECQ
jgi:hypothetical protein